MAPLAEQIPDGTHLFRVDVAGRQYPEPEHLGEPESIVGIVDVLDTGILFACCRVDELDVVSVFHESIDEPIPVVSRFDGDAAELLPEGFKRLIATETTPTNARRAEGRTNWFWKKCANELHKHDSSRRAPRHCGQGNDELTMRLVSALKIKSIVIKL